MEEAVAGIEAVIADPVGHREAAYEIAREYLAPDRVLPAMIESIFKEKLATDENQMHTDDNGNGFICVHLIFICG